jgi:hypothetical protein
MAVSPLNAGLPNSPFVDEGDNITLVWRQFLTALYNRTGGSNGGSIGDAATITQLATETAARIAGDITLTAGIAGEANRAETAEAALRAALATEAALRAAITITGSASIAQERADRIAADLLLVPRAQLCVLWAACNLLFLPRADPGFGATWLDTNGFLRVGIQPPAPHLTLESGGTDNWMLEIGGGTGFEWQWS